MSKYIFNFVCFNVIFTFILIFCTRFISIQYAEYAIEQQGFYIKSTKNKEYGKHQNL